MTISKLLGVCLLGLAAWPSLVGQAGAPRKAEPALKKVSKVRLKGMKDALVDLEKGFIKQKDYNDRPDSPAWGTFIALLKTKCGVVWEKVQRGKVTQEEMAGYNDVMRAEIEHRFGRGIFEKLWKTAQEKEKK